MKEIINSASNMTKKTISRCFFIACIFLSATVNAEPVTGLSGKYGCMMNRNFVGMTEAKKGDDGISSNVIGYFDFSNKTMEANIIDINGFGLSTAVIYQHKIQGNFEVTSGPIGSSYLITITATVTNSDNPAVQINNLINVSFNAMLVNSGATMFLQGVPPKIGSPETMVCNKM